MEKTRSPKKQTLSSFLFVFSLCLALLFFLQFSLFKVREIEESRFKINQMLHHWNRVIIQSKHSLIRTGEALDIFMKDYRRLFATPSLEYFFNHDQELSVVYSDLQSDLREYKGYFTDYEQYDAFNITSRIYLLENEISDKLARLSDGLIRLQNKQVKIFQNFVFLILLGILFLATVYYLSYRKGRRDRRRKGEVEGLLRLIENLQNKEQKRISNEIHDTIIQDLGAATLRIEGFRKLEELRGYVEQILGDAIRTLRNICYNLRPIEYETFTLEEICEQIIDEFREESGMVVESSILGLKDDFFVPEKKETLVKIFQELLQNIRKHSRAGRVSIRILASYPYLKLDVRDDGIGFSLSGEAPLEEHSPHFGLKIMRERVYMIGGTFSIDTEPGQGTQVTLQIPLSY